jgi:hypothetical protein
MKTGLYNGPMTLPPAPARELFGLALDYDIRLPGRLDAVTLDQVNELSRGSLVPDRAAIAVAVHHS